MQAPEIMQANPWQKEHELLCSAVREAGELAMRMFNAGVDSWDKTDGTPVSEADLAVDRLLATRLREATPRVWLVIGRNRARGHNPFKRTMSG